MKCSAGIDCYSMTGFSFEDCPNFFKCGNFREDASLDQLCDLESVWFDICCNDICPECGNKGVLTVGDFNSDLDLTLTSTLDEIRFDNYCPTCFWQGSINESHINFLITNQNLDPRAEGVKS